MDEPLLPTPMTAYTARDAEILREQRRAGNGQRRKLLSDLRVVVEEELSSASSPVSEDSTSPSSPSDGSASDRSSGTDGAQNSSPDTGRLFPVGSTSPTSHRNVPTPTAQDFIRRRSTSSETLNYETGKSVTLDRWAEWISSAEGSPVSPYPTPANGRRKPTNGGSGPSFDGSSMNFDPSTLSSRTSLAFCRPQQTWRPPMTDAYAAGLIDGEGSIGISKSNTGRGTFHARIDMAMSEKGLVVLRAMHKDYGGQLRKEREARGRWEAVWTWRLLDRRTVRAFLSKVEPHLILKREQADLALRLISLIEALPTNKRGHARWTEEAREQGALMKALMNDLNRRGPTVTPQAGWLARYVGGMWLTDQGSLLEPTGLARFSGTWPKWGSLVDGRVYELPTSVLPTDGNGSSSLPTPRSSDANGAGKHGTGGPDLRTAVLLPTVHGMPTEGQPRNPGPTGNELGRAITRLGDRMPPRSNDGAA